MNVTVIGTGFVGVVSAGVFAKFGHKVWGLDIDESKINSLKQGKVPFYEPGLKELINHAIGSENLIFTTNYSKAIQNAHVIILAVGTPSAPDGQADLKYVIKSAQSLAPHIKPGAIIAIKSTVPPGTNRIVRQAVEAKTQVNFYIASLPEFLKEGSAVQDALNPDRIIIGTTDKIVANKLLDLHKKLPGKRLVIRPQSAQMSKYAANAYLAQRITFINQIANLCEQNGADVQEVINAMGPDSRIGEHYWYPGLGYGGSCFPKDVKELAAYSKAIGESEGLLVKIDELNESRISKKMSEFEKKVGGWKDKKVAVLGLSFKKNTDDVREAPSLKVIPILHKAGARITGYDPKANDTISHIFSYISTTDNPYTAAKNADVVILLIEWPEIVSINLSKLASVMAGNVLIDTRNQFNKTNAQKVGLEYISIGR